jgi:hypothetical protein
MNFADQVNPFLYRQGGDIDGDFRMSADIIMTPGTKVQLPGGAELTSSDLTNTLKFGENDIEISKGLTVLGPLVAPNLANQALYPADIASNTITNTGLIQTHALSAAYEVDANYLIASTQVTTAKVLCSGDVDSAQVKTTKWTGKLAGEPDYDAMEYKQGEVVIGGGQLNGNDMPEMKMSHNEVHVTHGGTNGVFVSPQEVKVKQGATEEKYEDDGKSLTIDNYSEHVKQVLTPADPNQGLEALVTVAKYAMPFFQPSGAHPELRRRMASDYHFIDETGVMESYSVKPQAAQTIHLSNAELDETDANSLINKTGHALKTALRDTRNPRTIIAGTEAQFGLHQDFDDSTDAVPVHLLLTQPSHVDASYLQTQVDKQVLKCTNKSGVGFEVAYKGYDNSDVLTNSGTRLAVSGQDEVGKVYMGKWDNGLPADTAAESAYSHVNMQGSVRFSNSPTNWVSGDVMAEIGTSGLKCNNIESLGSQLDFAGDVDFTNATVTGLPGGGPGGMANIQDMTGGVKVTGFTETTGTGHDELNSTMYAANQVWHRVNSTVPMMYHQTDTWNNSPVITGDNFCHVNNLQQLNVNNSGHTMNNSLAYIQPLKVTGHNATQAGWLSEDYLATFEKQISPQSTYIKAGVLHDGYVVCEGITSQNGIDSLRDTRIQYETYAAKSRWQVTSEGDTVMTMADDLVDLYVPIHYPKKGSSAHFTHCHTMEPTDQNIVWADYVGRAIKSSGQYCVRDDDGIKHTTVANPISNSHAMCSAEVSDSDILGVLNTVESVLNQNIDHEHGGAIIKTPYQEADGYKVLRVAASGDVMGWMAKPDLSDCPLPELTGTYTKSIAGTNVGTVHGVSVDAILIMDGFSGEVTGRSHTFGDGENNTVSLTASELTISFDATQVSQLNSDIMSGAYKKYINGLEQSEEVIMHVNPDLSFTWSEHIPSVATRLNALEEAFVELTGP